MSLLPWSKLSSFQMHQFKEGRYSLRVANLLNFLFQQLCKLEDLSHLKQSQAASDIRDSQFSIRKGPSNICIFCWELAHLTATYGETKIDHQLLQDIQRTGSTSYLCFLFSPHHAATLSPSCLTFGLDWIKGVHNAQGRPQPGCQQLTPYRQTLPSAPRASPSGFPL